MANQTKLLLLVLLCNHITNILSLPQSQRTASLAEKAFKHSVRVKHFSCQAPQPRALEALDLIPEKCERCNFKIMPTYTVLHRCQKAGCCDQNYQTCSPLKTERVNLTFLVTEGGKISYLHVPAQNHTECHCK